MQREFEINDEEAKKIEVFKQKHKKEKCWVFYCFTPVPGLGTGVHVYCKTCNVMEDVTDYSIF